MIQRIDAMRLRNSMSESWNRVVERRIWCCWRQFFLLQFAPWFYTRWKRPKKLKLQKKGGNNQTTFAILLLQFFNDFEPFLLYYILKKVSFCNVANEVYLNFRAKISIKIQNLELEQESRFLPSLKCQQCSLKLSKSQQCSVKPRKLQKISAILDQQNKYSKLTCKAEDPRVNHKSLFSSIQYASSLDGAWTKKQLLSLHMISHLETRLSLGCVQQAMLKILWHHNNNHKSRIFHRKSYSMMLLSFYFFTSLQPTQNLQ